MKRSPSELSRYVRERQARIERLEEQIRGDFNETLARALGAEMPKVRALRRAEREYEAAVDELIPRRGGSGVEDLAAGFGGPSPAVGRSAVFVRAPVLRGANDRFTVGRAMGNLRERKVGA